MPYVVWNTLSYFAYYVLSCSGIEQFPEVNLSVVSYVKAVINCEYTILWYIRSLIIFALLAPAIMAVWRNELIAFASIVILCLFSILGIEIHFTSNYYLPFYLFGAYMALYHRDVVEVAYKKKSWWQGVVGCITVLALSILIAWIKENKAMMFVMQAVGVLTFWQMSELLIETRDKYSFFEHSFILYLTHSLLVKVAKVLIYRYLPHKPIVAYFEFVFLPIAAILFAEIIVWLSKRNEYVNKMWDFITGKMKRI